MSTAGRAWARAGFTLGVGTSIAANVGHTFIGPNPQVGALAFSAFWPIALLIALEVISRVDWPPGIWWGISRYGGLTTVALIAAFVSYRHMSGLLGYYGEDALTASIGPLAVDGLMVVCSTALLAIADNARRRLNPERKPAVIGELAEP
jgi:hypothetical protein